MKGTFDVGQPFDSGLGNLANNALGKALAILRSGPPGIRIRLGGDAVSGHSRKDPENNRMVTYSYRLQLSPKHGLITKLKFYEFDDRFTVISETEYDVEGYAFIHDFALTKNYYVIPQNPVSFDIAGYASGQKCAIHCVKWQPFRQLKIHAIPRPVSPKSAQVIEVTPSSFIYHFANGFESEDENSIVLDALSYPRFPDFGFLLEPGKKYVDIDPDQTPIGRLHRITLGLDDGHGSATAYSPRAMEFPRINPSVTGRPHRYVYTAAALHPHFNRPPQAIAKVDTETGTATLWSRGFRYYTAEPAFVPRGKAQGPPAGSTDIAEDDGWLVALCYDAEKQRSELVILDALQIENGPVAVLPLQDSIPHGTGSLQ
ncbi:unnamed protein product [Ostreobium quekettii]|uniref:Carotenoid oxygenase n=1 Tax=Ostreobium quekettii TaxID=121088 RepID=A0A8S1IPJ2_9CHLO|nr:unnamed protein product [Ostreobium quekettii]